MLPTLSGRHLLESSTPKPANDKSPRATLADFVKDNSALISGVAAFAGLTAFFSAQIKDVELQATLPGVTLLGAFLLAFELFMRFPAPPRHWRLAVFELVLMALLANVGWYWFKAFPAVWVPPLGAIVNLVVVLALPLLLTYLLGKAVTFVTVRLLRKKIEDATVIKIQQGAFVFFLIASFAGYFWAAHKLIPRPIKIHLPF